MNTSMITLLVVLFVGIGILLPRHKPVSQKCVNGFYLLCGALAWYTIETVDRSEPIYMSMLAVLLLCLLPMIVDSLLFLGITLKNQGRRVQ
ncbi:MAG: hypothetical protein PHW13_12975 [Methylococcales bacterium]|nr:hypothetical protein [Methylococcales bacterium]